MTHIHDEEVRELRNTISELQGYIAQAESNLRAELVEKVREAKATFIRNNDPRHPLYKLGEHQTALNIFDGVLALLEEELK